jgi:hypothetical protein
LKFQNGNIFFNKRPSPPSSWSFDNQFESYIIPVVFNKSIHHLCIPPTRSFPQLYDLKSKKQLVLCNPGKFYELFCKAIDSLWTTWELMILGQPIIILSDTPNACSHVVHSLVELIKPIIFGGDFRPYFTIQDPEFSRMISNKRVVCF